MAIDIPDAPKVAFLSAPATEAASAWTPPAVRIGQDADGAPTVAIAGAWNLRSLEPMMGEMTARLATLQPHALWDLSAITRLDHAGAMLLWRAWGYRRAERLLMRPEHEVIFRT